MTIANLDWRLRRLEREIGKPEETDNPLLAQIAEDPTAVMTLAGKPPDPWQAACLRSTSARMLWNCARQSGKSTLAASLSLRQALLEPYTLVLLVSRTLRQSKLLFKKVVRLYNSLGRPVSILRETACELELSNQSEIVSLPATEETIRGYSDVRLLVLDEAARVPDDLYAAVMPMIATSRGRMIALTTPWGKRGWFFTEWVEGIGWERVTISARECPRLSEDLLDEYRRSRGERAYMQGV